MVEYLEEVRKIEKSFDGFEVRYVPRLDNRDADHLAWISSSRAPMPPDMIVERLAKLSVKPKHQDTESADLMIIDGEELNQADDWMKPIRMLLENRPLPNDNLEAE
jgi:hypothetical protein